MSSALPEGVLLVDKPVGISSFDVIRRLKHAARNKGQPLFGTMQHYVAAYGTKLKIGHAGTLDPLASGLMIIGIGPATKLLQQYLKLPKVYEAEVCIGERTTTGDREGEVLEAVRVSPDLCTQEHVQAELQRMLGVLELEVPAYSAIKQGGEALYKKVRRGENVDVPIKPMEVHSSALLHVTPTPPRCMCTVQFDVGSGTYVRSLAEELGRRLGYPARLENLRRTQVGEWQVEDALSLT